MRSLFEKKPWVLLISALALVALVALASGLGRVPFHEAQPLVRAPQRGGGFDARGIINSWMEIPIWIQISVFMAIITIAILIGLLLSPEVRKMLLRAILRVVIVYWAIYYLFNQYGDEITMNALEFLNPDGSLPVSSSDVSPPVFTPSENMLLVSYILSFLILLVFAFVTWRAYKFWAEIRRRDGGSPLNKIADIARSSIRDLSSGRDTTDVIMNCYFRMSEVVADRRNLQRGESMTPGEFATRLEQAGLPGDAVKRLTRLFESVRYGARKSGQNEINEAVACLNTILAYCGQPS